MFKKSLITLIIISFALMLSAKDNEVKITAKDFAAKAGNLIDKQVVVTGKVLHVCKHGGMRLRLGETEENSIMVSRVQGDKSKFSDDLEGKSVVFIGMVKEHKITKEKLMKMKERLEKAGKEHKEAHKKAGHKDEESIHEHHNSEKEELENINAKLLKIEKEKLEYVPMYWLEYKSHKLL